MKRLISIAIFGTLALLPVNVYCADTTAFKAQVWEVLGKASYTLPGEAPKPVRVGTELPQGAVVRTGDGAAVEMRFAKNATLRLTQNCVLGLEKMETGAGKAFFTQLTLFQGAAVGSLKKLEDESKFEVKIINGIASVKEGQFRIQSDGYLVLLSGTMLFAYVPEGGEGTLFTLSTPPAVYFTPAQRALLAAPPELVREVQAQIQTPLRRP
jgi:hypothetical protein